MRFLSAIFGVVFLTFCAGGCGCSLDRDTDPHCRMIGTPADWNSPYLPYKAVTSIAVSQNGKLLAAARMEYGVTVYSLPWGFEECQIPARKGGEIMQVEFADNDTLLTAGKDKQLRFWNPHDGKLIKSYQHEGLWFMPFALSPNRKFIATLESDDKVYVWDFATGGLIKTMDGQGGGVQSVTFLPDNNRLVTSSNYTNEVILWDIAQGRKLWTTPAETFSLAVSPDGKLMAFRKDHSIEIWNLDSRKKLYTLMPQQFGIGHFSFAFSPDGKCLGAAELGGDIVMWDLKTQRMLCDYNGPVGDGLCIEPGPESRYFYVGGYRNSTVCRWPIPDEE
ncbi:MAG TPA: hypothetical protein PKK48_02460 [Phycisphaerae bacterium]|nr:hypothetical protein [Phycisphaerae bacterium]HPS53322.1 hypothetical protein [Phycisphaerae bacterium]